MNRLDPRSSPKLFDDVPTPAAAPPVMPLREVLRADLGRYLDLDAKPSRLTILRTLLFTEGVWPLFAYRLGRWLLSQQKTRGPRRLLLAGLWLVQAVIETVTRLVFDIRLDLRADIGPGFYVGHFKSIYVGPGVRIGRDCNIGQMCFVAAAGHGPGARAPVIGNRVYMGVGAKLIGPLRVGDDVAIGANAVLLEDVPDMGVVVGNPARVVSLRGSEDFISIKRRDGAFVPKPDAKPELRART